MNTEYSIGYPYGYGYEEINYVGIVWQKPLLGKIGDKVNAVLAALLISDKF
ncbi:MAG: hypothetical protein K2X39_01340 [Silvanigrellaceae bacterium]|nr:hypothetical protein [Silvanigrellaceae bacterium]